MMIFTSWKTLEAARVPGDDDTGADGADDDTADDDADDGGRKDPGSRIKDQGSRIQDQGSRIEDHGPCFGTNEHPRRDTDVISRQSKAPLEPFNST